MGKLPKIGGAQAALSKLSSSARRKLRSNKTAPAAPSNEEPEDPEEPAAMEEEDDDMYGSAAGETGLPGVKVEAATAALASNGAPAVKEEDGADEDEDEDDDDDDDDDSDDDIEIITERKPGEPAEPSGHTQRQSSAAVKIEAPRTATPAGNQQPTAPGLANAAAPIGRVASPAVGRPGSSYPPVKTSNLDFDANPTLSATGKPIFNTDMDADFTGDTAPWRRPGSDMTDYYNYGFDEGTWAAYCIKQRQNRGEVAEDRKRMEQLGAMMGGNMPFGMMPGMDASGAAGMPMPNMDQMQQMMSMMGGMPGMPGMDAGMGQGQLQNQGYQNQGGYSGGRNQGGRGKRW